MKKIGLLILGALLVTTSSNVFAQVVDDQQGENLDGFYSKQVTRKGKKPFSYPYVREDDVVWSHRVWRVVDFREKMNQVFYYPIEEEQGRMNLYTLIDKAATEGTIKLYNDDMFTEEITDWTAKKKSLGKTSTTTIYGDPDIDGTQTEKDSVIVEAMRPEDVKTLRIKEDWFIDKKRSVRDVRIIGISLIYYQDKGDGSAPLVYTLGWLRFNDPEVRNLLANSEVYNEKNDAARPSYDDVFQKRLFTSYVIRESNRFGDRDISKYASGLDALAESERIENDIFDKEQDMWEY